MLCVSYLVTNTSSSLNLLSCECRILKHRNLVFSVFVSVSVLDHPLFESVGTHKKIIRRKSRCTLNILGLKAKVCMLLRDKIESYIP